MHPFLHIAIVLLSFLPSVSKAQSFGAYNTDRRSFTILYVDEDRKIGPYYQKGVQPEFRNSLFWNNIPTQSVGKISPDLENMATLLSNMKVGNQIMAHWWNRQPDGIFTLDTIAARGRYNALALQRQVAMTGPRGQAELEDAGLNLVSESYVLVIVAKNLRTMKEYYDEQDRNYREAGSKTRAERTRRGYIGQAEGYLYRLVYDDKTRSDFYDMWIYKDDSPEIKQQKVAAFNQYRFRFEPVKVLNAKGAPVPDSDSDASLKRVKNLTTKGLTLKDLTANALVSREIMATTDIKEGREHDQDLLANWCEEVVNRLLNAALEKAIGENSFPVWEKRPVVSKIGIKEGLYPEKRFVVYERRERANGSVVKRKRAVVRVKKVTDNRSNDVNPDAMSSFYRTGGLGIVQPGMVLETKRELGIGIHAFLTPGLSNIPGSNADMQGFGAGAELNLSLLMGRAGWYRAPVGLKLGVNYAELYRNQPYRQSSGAIPSNRSRTYGYIRKDWYFLSVMHLGLWAGYGVDAIKKANTTSDTEKPLNSKTIIPTGLEYGINLPFGAMAFAQAEAVNSFDDERFILYRAGFRLNL